MRRHKQASETHASASSLQRDGAHNSLVQLPLVAPSVARVDVRAGAARASSFPVDASKLTHATRHSSVAMVCVTIVCISGGPLHSLPALTSAPCSISTATCDVRQLPQARWRAVVPLAVREFTSALLSSSVRRR